MGISVCVCGGRERHEMWSTREGTQEWDKVGWLIEGLDAPNPTLEKKVSFSRHDLSNCGRKGKEKWSRRSEPEFNWRKLGGQIH